MKILHILLLSCVLSVLFIVLFNLGYRYNYLPINITMLFNIKNKFSIIIDFLLITAFIFIIAFITYLNKNIIIRTSRQYVFITIIFVIINIFLKFYSPFWPKMTFLSEITLFSLLIFTFRTIFYSIIYKNLLK